MRAAIAGLLVASAACAGARYDVKATTSRYPVSLSPAIPDRDQQPLYVNRGLQVVGQFEHVMRKFSFFYSATGGELDVSSIVNSEVERHRGEGVVKLQITAKNCASNWLFPLTLLPIYPGCQRVTISGTVVRRTAMHGTVTR